MISGGNRWRLYIASPPLRDRFKLKLPNLGDDTRQGRCSDVQILSQRPDPNVVRLDICLPDRLTRMRGLCIAQNENGAHKGHHSSFGSGGVICAVPMVPKCVRLK